MLGWRNGREAADSASTKTINGQTTSRSYTVVANSNLLQGFGQTAGGTSTNVAYAYNANGDLTNDGLRTYTYDAEGRLSAVTTGATDASPTTRYAHNALGQRVFKTEPLYPPAEGDESDPGFLQSLLNFFAKLWGPGTTDAEKLGYAFMYDEEGTLLAETGTGGANSGGSTQYIYLPTANGPMPIAVVIDGQVYAVHSDHLNTPRRLTNSQGQAVWQWAYSAFGDEKPTLAKYRFANLDINPNPGTTGITSPQFNLRYWGMYGDPESRLFYNGRRSYNPDGGNYTQNDPIGLGGGLHRRAGLDGNPLGKSDPTGLSTCRWIGPVLQCNWGPPPSLNPENPAGSGPTSIPWPKLIPQPLVDACGAAVDRLKNWMLSSGQRPSKTPNEGIPGSIFVNPGSGQERGYGDDGLPLWDIDWDQHHGPKTPVPHGHEWGRDANGRPIRGGPVPIEGPWQRK